MLMEYFPLAGSVLVIIFLTLKSNAMKNFIKLILFTFSLVCFSLNNANANRGNSDDAYTPYFLIDANTPLPYPVLPPEDLSMCIDKDKDGYGNIGYFKVPDGMDRATFVEELKSQGWTPSEECVPGLDCNDNDPAVYRIEILFRDQDGDRYVLMPGAKQCIGLLPPQGWLLANMVLGTDCDDSDPLIFRWVSLYEDKDNDGYRDGGEQRVCWNYTPWPVPGFIIGTQSKGVDEKNNFIDCDLDPNGHIAKLLYKDEGDFWVNGQGEWKCVFPDMIPAGFITPQQIKGRPDCAPDDPTKWREEWLLPDPDGDKHVPTGTVAVKECIGNIPAGKMLVAERLGTNDCDPFDGTKWRNVCIFDHYINTNQWVNTTVCWGGDPHPLECGIFQPGAEFTVYPNPVADRLNINPAANWNERAEIKLVDQYARVVRTLVVPNAVKGQTFTINTSDLKPGLYQLTIRRGEMVESRTIAVKL